ncbi:zinc finger, CCHC-type containing protein [Tanacetum coccineum]
MCDASEFAVGAVFGQKDGKHFHPIYFARKTLNAAQQNYIVTRKETNGSIMEYLVNISKRRAFWSLNEDILKITILKTNTPYPSRKIWHIHACTHQRPQRNKAQYAVSREDQYAVLEIWNEYNILEDIKRGSYSKKSPIRRIQSLDTSYRTDFLTL